MKLGHDFGSVPFGVNQVLARALRRCSCDQRFIDIAHDIACPIHGLDAHLRRSLLRRITA